MRYLSESLVESVLVKKHQPDEREFVTNIKEILKHKVIEMVRLWKYMILVA